MYTPLADRIRPKTLEDVAGQKHILGDGMMLKKIIESGRIPNMIFYGPSGVGKTTVARIIAELSGLALYKLNGTNCSTADIRQVVADTETIDGMNGVLLYLDEIQYLNKRQQQSLLEHIENGRITLISSTTENPYFYVYSAILSRSTVFEFKTLTPEDIEPVIRRGFSEMEKELAKEITPTDEAVKHIARACGGDVRKALNATELCALAGDVDSKSVTVDVDMAIQASQRSAMRYDRDGDEHYDILSAFQKSIRGSDENAALHYLARLLEAGDLISPCRRLLVIASEDIGLAYPQAVSIVNACVDSAERLGLPEARIPLAQAVITLCTAPKSNSAICAIDDAMADVKNGNFSQIPQHLKDAHYDGAKKLGRGQTYKYPHSYPNSYVEQQYLPDSIKDRVYYKFGENKTEQAALEYRNKIKGKR